MSISLPIFAPTPGVPARPPAAPTSARAAHRLRDAHGRLVRDLRLSVTDRCNYRCVYCMDPDHRYMPKRDLLDVEQYLIIARAAVELGIDTIRITGGEPTLYPQLDTLLEGVGALDIDDLAMTTNGSLMQPAAARRWRAFGLRRITMSLDSMRPDRVRRITRAPATPEGVATAIAIARDAGLDPIKVNAVVMRGINDDEVADFADFARTHAIDMRLIEWMPLDSGRTWDRGAVVSATEMIEQIERRHALRPVGRDDAQGTALHFEFADGAPGRIGIIASVTRPFCGARSRLRITADGKVRPCLFSHEEWSLRPLLDSGATPDSVAQFIADAMWTKQAGHGIGERDFEPPERGMSAIGG